MSHITNMWCPLGWCNCNQCVPAVHCWSVILSHFLSISTFSAKRQASAFWQRLWNKKFLHVDDEKWYKCWLLLHKKTLFNFKYMIVQSDKSHTVTFQWGPQVICTYTGAALSFIPFRIGGFSPLNSCRPVGMTYWFSPNSVVVSSF